MAALASPSACAVEDGECPRPGRREHWVFGYGSIINSKSRAATIGVDYLPTLVVRLRPAFPYRRCWNFHSSTGFTALGLEPTSSDCPLGMNGVLVRINGDEELAQLDNRETGYERVEVDPHDVMLYDPSATEANAVSPNAIRYLKEDTAFDDGRKQIWAYVPRVENRKLADQDHPVCQTYVDTVLAGCFEVGGQEFVEDFVRTTFCWSMYYLYDTPTSRRPWLNRPSQWKQIDHVLETHGTHTKFKDRRHPEEFAGRWFSSLRGMWGVPSRNVDFVGRERELGAIASVLNKRLTDASSNRGVSIIETVGLGGVGKTQLAIEYCYRQYHQSVSPAVLDEPACKNMSALQYGLILWIRAGSMDSISKSFRELAGDIGIPGAVDSMKSLDQVVQEIKSKLYRTKCNWLVIFDNYEPDLVSAESNNPIDDIYRYIPKGGHGAGHVLITSRVMLPGFDRSHSVRLECFCVEDSVKLLQNIQHLDTEDTMCLSLVADCSHEIQAAADLATALGHLPLALAIAGSYMRRCDLSCAEYVARLEESNQALFSEQPHLMDYSMGLGSSLALSLEQVGDDIVDVLNALAFLGPEGITKELLQHLIIALGAITRADVLEDMDEEENAGASESTRTFPSLATAGTLVFGALVVSGIVLAIIPDARAYQRSQIMVGATAVVASVAAWVVGAVGSSPSMPRKPMLSSPHIAEKRARKLMQKVSIYSEVNNTWSILKTFSLLSIRQRDNASMHRLLQGLVRSRQTLLDEKRSICCSLRAIADMWSFAPSDTSTWRKAGAQLEHVIVISKHACLYSANYGLGTVTQLSAYTLLCEAALYLSMALSEFTGAKRLLVEACESLQTLRISSSSKHVKIAMSRAYLTLGKVERYCGDYAAADDNLKAALANAEEECDYAAVHHEIGVLFLKREQYAAAEDALNASLQVKYGMKEQARQQGKEAVDKRLPLLAYSGDDAATIHQLAVVNTKLRRLTKAEDLLRLALSAESRAGEGGKAATLRQLGRVLDRLGKIEESLMCLQEAHALYKNIYGDALHINVGAIEYQLGACLCRLHRFDESSQHFDRALSIQKGVYGDELPHMEIAATLGEMGKMEKKRGAIAKARAHFEKQAEMIRALLRGFEQGCNDEDKYVALGAVGKSQKQLEGQLINALHLIRSVVPRNTDDEVTTISRLDDEIAKYQRNDPNNSKKAAREHKARVKHKKALLLSAGGELWKCIPVCDMFRADEEAAYSDFDASGFPTKDKDGKPLTKSQCKRLKKKQAVHQAKRQKWLQQHQGRGGGT
jgi:tetratricopeptide (TPR) repeat protein